MFPPPTKLETSGGTANYNSSNPSLLRRSVRHGRIRVNEKTHAKQSAGILLYRRNGLNSKCCSSTPAARSGRRRISAPGQFPRANTLQVTTRCRRRKGSFRKKPGSIAARKVAFPGRNSADVRKSHYRMGHRRRVRRGRNPQQHHSRLNGRRNPEKCGTFPRSTVPDGSLSEVATRKVHPAQRAFFSRLTQFLRTQETSQPTA